MGFIESLNKYGKSISLNKTRLYHFCEENKGLLDAKGISNKMKKEIDLFELEVLIHSLLAQKAFDDAYDLFTSGHYDMLDYISYEEKRLMFNNDIKPLLESLPHFLDQESQKEIYLPAFEPFVNEWFTDDYQIMLLRQHRDYLKNSHFNISTPRVLYGIEIFKTDFSRLETVFEDERHIDLYCDELKTVFIYLKEDFSLLNKVIVMDEKGYAVPQIEDIKELMPLIEEYKYEEALNMLHDKHFIIDKTYNKLLKKCK